MGLAEYKRVYTAALAAIAFLLAPSPARGQGGPPYYTNDPGTPGNRNWEINLGYMPFLYNATSTSHMPDVDINYGLGDRIQLTFENAWLRVNNGTDPPKYGAGQDQLGVKWRFYDNDRIRASEYPSSRRFRSIIPIIRFSEASLRQAPASSCLSNSPKSWDRST